MAAQPIPRRANPYEPGTYQHTRFENQEDQRHESLQWNPAAPRLTGAGTPGASLPSRGSNPYRQNTPEYREWNRQNAPAPTPEPVAEPSPAQGTQEDGIEYVDVNTGQSHYRYAEPKADPQQAVEEADDAEGDDGNDDVAEPSRLERARERLRNTGGETESLRRNTAMMGIYRSLDNFFGSGRSAQGDIGERQPLFQDRIATLQAEVDRENSYLDTVREERAHLTALREAGLERMTEEERGRAEAEYAAIETRMASEAQRQAQERCGLSASQWQQATDAVLIMREQGISLREMQGRLERAERALDRTQDAKQAMELLKEYGIPAQLAQQVFNRSQLEPDAMASIRAQLRQFTEGGAALYAAQADVSRATTQKDILAQHQVALHAFNRYGAALSDAMTQQELRNLESKMRQLEPLKLDQLEAQMRMQGRVEGEITLEQKVRHTVGMAAAAQALSAQGQHRAAAALIYSLGVGMVSMTATQIQDWITGGGYAMTPTQMAEVLLQAGVPQTVP